MQPGLELEEIQVAPIAADSVVNALVGRAAARTGQSLGGADDLEVDAPLCRVEVDLGDLPWRLKAQCSAPFMSAALARLW
jgi:hypothetical protein